MSKTLLADAITIVSGLARSIGFGTKSPNHSSARCALTFSSDQAADGERVAIEAKGYCTTDGAVANYDWINGANRLVALTGFRWGANNTGKLQLGLFSAGNYLAHVDFKVGEMEVLLGDVKITEAAKGVILPGGPKIVSGSGSPEGAVTAPVGSLYLRTDGGAGSSLYVKESGTGNTGWVAK